MKNEKQIKDLLDSIYKSVSENKNPGRQLSELGQLLSGKKKGKISFPQPIMWPIPMEKLIEEYQYAQDLILFHKENMAKVMRGALITAKEIISSKGNVDAQTVKRIRKLCKKNDAEPPMWRLTINEEGNQEIEVEKYHDFAVDVDPGAYIFGLGKYYETLMDSPYTAPAIIAIKTGAKAEALSYAEACKIPDKYVNDLIKINTSLRGILFSFKYLLNGVNFCCGMLSPEPAVVPTSYKEILVYLMKIILVGTYLSNMEEVAEAYDLIKKIIPMCEDENISLSFVSEVFGIGFAVDFSHLSPEQFWEIVIWEGKKYFLPRMMAEKIFN